MGRSSADFQKKTKEKEKKEERRFRKRNQFRYGGVVQPWTVDVFALNWSAHSKDLCCEKIFTFDQREQPQETLKSLLGKPSQDLLTIILFVLRLQN